MRKKSKAKQKIIDAAWELFRQYGYDDTTVDQIIELSDTSKGTFYYYFNSKDELLSTLSDVLDDKYEELKQKMDPNMNAFEKLMYINYEAHCMMEKKIDYQLLASLYSTQLITKGERHLLDQDRVYYQLVHEIVTEGQKRGEITNDKTVEEICKLYGIYERALVSDWCMCQGDYSFGAYSKEYMPIMMEHFRK